MSRYAVEIIIHGAQHVPVGDIFHFSSDPYIHVTLYPQNPTHGQPVGSLRQQVLEYRTHTVPNSLEPTFENKWIVGGILESGFVLKLRLRDEDQGQFFRDDRLGKGVLLVPTQGEKLGEGWELRKECKIEKRKGAIKSHVSTYVARLVSKGGIGHHTKVWVSVKVLGVSRVLAEDPDKIYTIGPRTFVRHSSPLIGFALPTSRSDNVPAPGQPKRQLTTTSFVANRLQLVGPVPAALRHRYVGYNPFIEWMFTKSGIRGRLLHRALNDQYAKIYGYGKNTEWGVIATSDDQDNGRALAETFLRMTSFGTQGRIFTYVITLDGEMRFTETGEEFAIDLLSKHSMHADGAKEITFSGEFFVRLMEEYEGQSGEEGRGDSVDGPQDGDPKHYELVIDNDSGTYRPRKELLPVLEEFLAREDNFGGLGRVLTMDCFDKTLERWKEERKEIKRRARGKGEKGEPQKMVQMKRNGSTSSLVSDIESRSEGRRARE